VGKAKDLKKRVGSYFSKRNDVKTEILIKKVHSIEPIITGTEYEALLLENTLIKEHQPHYNINLKNGKT
jgi:excinuclease ABC subunit C